MAPYPFFPTDSALYASNGLGWAEYAPGPGRSCSASVKRFPSLRKPFLSLIDAGGGGGGAGGMCAGLVRGPGFVEGPKGQGNMDRNGRAPGALMWKRGRVLHTCTLVTLIPQGLRGPNTPIACESRPQRTGTDQTHRPWACEQQCFKFCWYAADRLVSWNRFKRGGCRAFVEFAWACSIAATCHS